MPTNEYLAALVHSITACDRGEAPGPKPERAVRGEAVVAPAGEAAYAGRVIVGIKSYRRRLLDEDNLCPKYFVDGLRYAGIIRGDAPGQVSIRTTQEKVKTKEEERTEITITPI